MTSYFNGSVPLYVSDGQFSDLSDQVATNTAEITDIEVTIRPDFVQNFKAAVGFVNIPLVAGSFTPLTGTDEISALPSQWNSLGDLHFQYVGTLTAFYLISYSVSGLLTTLSEGITFAIRHNSNILPASANVQHYNTSEYVTTPGYAIKEILPNDIIRLEAFLLGGTNDTLKLENVNLIIARISGLAL